MMMKLNWKKTALGALSAALAAYLLLAVTAFNKPQGKATVCTQVKINIADSSVDGFLDADEIKRMLQGKGIYPLGRPMAAVDTRLIEETLRENGESTVVVGIGTVAAHLRDLAKSYKEAQIAIEVGKVFDTEKYIISYENLGIGRLIYQLPTTLCEIFLSEVFKKNSIDTLDQETLFTINKFFENNLILSETARKLFVHRNTLVYRLEKIKKLTGLDLREFDDAITFKVALMVKKYLASRGIEA